MTTCMEFDGPPDGTLTCEVGQMPMVCSTAVGIDASCNTLIPPVASSTNVVTSGTFQTPGLGKGLFDPGTDLKQAGIDVLPHNGIPSVKIGSGMVPVAYLDKGLQLVTGEDLRFGGLPPQKALMVATNGKYTRLNGEEVIFKIPESHNHQEPMAVAGA